MQFGSRLLENTRQHREGDPARAAIARPRSHSERGCCRSSLIAGVVIALPRGGGGGAASQVGGGRCGGAAYAVPGALKPFDTCDTVLQYFKDQAPEYLIEHVGGNMARTDAGGWRRPRLRT